ncbi:girdin [Solenopsis invicta]|uniref:girdin n=1 Tax=Solenopsis invicta TaxID=13686 RepID=UPI0001FEB956|nr:girdin [Solenopsis invicta]
MSTPAKRMTRLRTRQLSVKVAPENEFKLGKSTNKNSKTVAINKSSKTGTINKNLKKVNVNAQGKNLSISKSIQNVSLRKSRISPKCLRPRTNRKNYCDDSKLLKQQDSVVILEKLNVKGKKKVPVYKAIEPSKKSLEDKNDVYDFKFDTNDSREKAKKKQRKRNVNKEKGKISKKTNKKVTVKKINREVIESPDPKASSSVKITQNNPPLEFAVPTKSTRENITNIETLEINMDVQTVEKSINKDIEKDIEQSRIDVSVHIIENSTEDTAKNIQSRPDKVTNIQAAEETPVLRRSFAKQVRKEESSKPRIISVENADNIIVTRTPPNNIEDSRPFRPKNIFDNKISLKESNITLRNSLLMDILSPIVKTSSACDFGSPWRPPIVTFSQTKHFIQSTPFRNFEKSKEIKKITKKNIETNKENMEMDKKNIKMDKENIKMDKENIKMHEKNMEIDKENIKMDEENMLMDKENMEMDKENMEMDKENMKMNKENKGRRNKERKKAISPRKKFLQKKLLISENKAPEKVRAVVAIKSDLAAPARVSLGEIKNLLHRPNVNNDNKQTIDQTHSEVDKSLAEQKEKLLVDYLNFSDTFDILSETERLSNIGDEAPLFLDLEPTRFTKPPQHSYKRKRAVRFDFSQDSGEEEKEEKENIKSRPKKKKLTKTEKEQEKRINEWIKTVNTTFQEIEEHDLVIE